MTHKERDILHDNGAATVRREPGRFTVYREGATAATSDSSYPATDDGLSLAIARADYIGRVPCTACAVAVDPLAVFPGGVCLECWQGRTHNGLTVEDCREGLRLAAGR